MPARKPAAKTTPRRKPDLSIPAEDVHVAEPEAEDAPIQVGRVTVGDPVAVDDGSETSDYVHSIELPGFSDVKLVEYLVESLDVRSQAVNDARRERVSAELRDLLADGYTLLSSAGGAHGSRTLFVFTLAK